MFKDFATDANNPTGNSTIYTSCLKKHLSDI